MLPEDIKQEERELGRRLEERSRKKRGKAAKQPRGEGHHFNDPVLISVLHGLQGHDTFVACLDMRGP